MVIYGEGDTPKEMHVVCLREATDRLEEAVDSQVADEELVIQAAGQV